MWPVSVMGKPGIVMSQMCVNCTFVPSGRLIEMGFVARRLFYTGVLDITNTDAVPVSAIAWAGLMDMAFALCSMSGCNFLMDTFAAALMISRVQFDAMAVLSSSLSILVKIVVFGLGYN